MTLTLGIAPLSHQAPTTANYRFDGPRNRVLFTPFPRRLRARLGGVEVLDTEAAMLLHESGIFPQVYVPVGDVAMQHLAKTDLSTHCPYKGDASYWTVSAGGRTEENAVWGYEAPIESAAFIEGYVAFEGGRMDQWFDEDDEIFGHIRDPFHRVDARPTSRRYVVRIGDETVADTTAAFVVSETGFDNRIYIPAADVATDRFDRSTTTTHCPHKGDSVYWSHAASGTTDVAWSYPEPLEEALRVAGYWSFDGEGVVVDRLDD